MKKTSEEFMEWLGLKIGDKVKFLDDIWVIKYDKNEVHEVYLHRKYGGYDQILWLTELIDRDIDILPQPKRVGDLKCEDFKDCFNCPLKAFRLADICIGTDNQTLYEKLEEFDIRIDQEIYNLLKARLDKEVEE